MADIFISYSQKDRRRVKPLVDALTAEGYQVWWDLDIRAGESFDELIETTLEEVRCVVTVWSQHAVASKWVRRESAWAQGHEKFVSIRIDEEIELPVRFYDVHTLSLVGWEGARDAAAFQALLADIAKTGGPSSSLPDPSPPPDPEPIPDDTAPIPPQTGTPTPSVPSSSEQTKGSLASLTVFHDILKDGSQGPAMVVIPGGSFQIGSPADEPGRYDDEGPVHGVNLRPFAIGRTQVTFAQYDRFALATGRRKPDDRGWGRGERPVIDVSWKDATEYAAWLSVETGRTYRLPTEAEWEYAARAGTSTPFWTGDCIHTDQANYNGNYDYNDCSAETGIYRQRTVPAGSLPANPWGLHEIAGNVWEWTQDCWHSSYQGAPPDGSAWGEENGGNCARRVLRGGAWIINPRILRSANRSWLTADGANDYVGIRLARTL